MEMIKRVNWDREGDMGDKIYSFHRSLTAFTMPTSV